MTRKLKGFGKIFAFTFRQHTGTKRYRMSIVIGVLLCLLIPMLSMVAVEHFGDSGTVYIPDIAEVFVVDKSKTGGLDLGDLPGLHQAGFNDISYNINGTEVEPALRLAEGSPKSLVVVIDESDEGFAISVLLPENTELNRKDANAFSDFLSEGFRYVLMQKSGMDYDTAVMLATPIYSEIIVADSDEDSMSSDIRHMLSLIIGYILVMVIYFLVLLYGQGVANTVIMEKNSKLMELFLLSVDPGAMITGKVLAVSLSGALQFTSWVVGLICGFVGGTLIVKAINPATSMVLISIFDGIGAISGMFSIGGIIVALLILLAGFLLYCSLSAIGGAIAGKPEDLSSTNMLFTLALIASFFAVIMSGGLTGDIGNLSPLFLWIPFTGVLTAPSQLILGALPVLAGLGVFAVTVAVSLVIMSVAGKLYIAMVHHRGNPPDLTAAFKMLKKN